MWAINKHLFFFYLCVWHNVPIVSVKGFMIQKIMVLCFATSMLYSCNNQQASNTQTTTESKLNPEQDSTFAQDTASVANARPAITYTQVIKKDSINRYIKAADTNSLKIIAAINRADVKFLKRFDTIVVPSDLSLEVKYYFPFPLEAPFLAQVKKIIFFSYPTQSFAAYENGRLVYTGPTSMGRKKDMTPTGLFYTNWKAEETISTFNDEWKLKWNFNIENKLGVGFHQYEMPGYPASHSCLRLTENDAKDLYGWADQWTIKGTDNILAQGTPVIVFGSYAFGNSRPWRALAQNANALDISVQDLESVSTLYLPDIMQKQEKRDKIKK